MTDSEGNRYLDGVLSHGQTYGEHPVAYAVVLAEKLHNLKVVIDHLAKPPIKDKMMGDWSEQFTTATEYPNMYAKVSGLNTAAD